MGFGGRSVLEFVPVIQAGERLAGSFEHSRLAEFFDSKDLQFDFE